MVHEEEFVHAQVSESEETKLKEIEVAKERCCDPSLIFVPVVAPEEVLFLTQRYLRYFEDLAIVL